jgi:flagellar biosynthesis protein FlhG
MVISQLDHLKERMGIAQGQPAPMIAVASGKGGVGKTHVALNLSLEHAKHGQKTLLLDADAGMADLHILIGSDHPWHWGHYLEGQAAFQDILCPVRGNFDLIQGFSGVARIDWMRGQAFERVLDVLRQAVTQYEMSILDVGAGVGENSLFFAAAADAVLLVVTPELTSLADAYGLMKTLAKRRPGLPIGVVANQVRSMAEGEQVWSHLCKVSEQFLGLKPPLLASILHDDQLARAALQQQPILEFAPFGSFAQGIRDLKPALGLWLQSFHSAPRS